MMMGVGYRPARDANRRLFHRRLAVVMLRPPSYSRAIVAFSFLGRPRMSTSVTVTLSPDLAWSCSPELV